MICALTVLALSAGAAAVNAAEYNNAGIEAYGRNEWREAISNFEKAYELEPQHETVRHNLCNAHQAAANALAKNADFPAAVKHLELAIGIDPTNPAPLVQLGAYYLRLDMVPEAILRLEEAIELKPGDLDAHEFLGQAYYLDNDLPSARAQWEYVLEMAPDRPGLQERYQKAFREEAVEGDFKRGTSRHFTISYPDDLPTHLRGQVLNLLERAYLEVGRKTGGVYPPGPMQVIAYKEEQFSEATQLESHVGAVYDGKIRVPLTERGEFLNEEELRRRLTHEYVHVVVRYAGGPNVPWWMNEGLAEVLSRNLSSEATTMLRRAHQEQLAFSLSDLEGSQLNVLKPDVLRLAYAQSQATVELMWNRFGQRRFMQMLSDISAGVAPEEALRRNYRRTYSTLEQEVAAGYL
jgi:tetratricopeptide (TPR) repeat protein